MADDDKVAEDKGAAGSAKPRRPAAKKAEPAPAPAPTPESIGIEGVIRVGGHTLTEDGWTTEEEKD
jgi:hypothetical protein